MSCRRCFRNKIGLIFASVGVGLIAAILIPFWGWIVIAGLSLIYLGWCALCHH